MNRMDLYSISIGLIFFIMMMRYEKRKYFIVRVIISAILGYLINWLLYTFVVISNDFNNSLLTFVRFLIVDVVWGLALILPFKANLKQTLFSCTSGLAIEQISSSIMNIIFMYVSLPSFISREWISFTKIVIVYTIVYTISALLYYVLFKKFFISNTLNSNARYLISIIIIFTCLGVNRLFPRWTTQEIQLGHYIYAIIASSCALFVQYGIDVILYYRRENEIMTHMHYYNKSHLNEMKELLEVLDGRLHDIHHIFSQIKEIAPNYQLDDSILVAEHHVKTGCLSLDIVLSEKGYICEKRHIVFTHMADGNALHGLSETDVYSLFSNLIDNAIDAVSKLNEEERCINLYVQAKGETVVITVENAFDGNVKWGDKALPLTSKKSTYHGYGIKNILLVANKYGGSANFSTNGNIFTSSVFLSNTNIENNNQNGNK